MYLLGLRNYGLQFKHTVHNLGEEFILYTDYIISKIFRLCLLDKNIIKKNRYTATEYTFNNQFKLTTLLLNTYMNSTGELLIQLKSLVNEINSSELMLVYDDLLIKTGNIKASKIKLKTKHNGVLSIINQLVNSKIGGIRIGITKNKDIVTNEFVLSKIENIEIFHKVFYKYIIHMINLILENNNMNIDLLIKHLNNYSDISSENASNK